SEKPWGSYFREITSNLARPRLRLPDQAEITWKDHDYGSSLEAAVDRIDARQTIFLAVADSLGKLPGERLEYCSYLQEEVLSGDRYVTGAASAHPKATCPLCHVIDVPVYPNALKGAGINLANADRAGAFPGINIDNAWKGYSLCKPCSDLLFIYKFHVLKEDESLQRRPFTNRIAGEQALIVPHFSARSSEWRPLLKMFRDVVKTARTDVELDEDDMLDRLREQRALLSVDFLWADLGQSIENLRGMISDVPPTRLRFLSTLNAAQTRIKHAVFPERHLPSLRPTLGLNALKDLFKLPGGKKTQKENEGPGSFHLRRQIASCVYHNLPLLWSRLSEAIIITARAYWDEVTISGNWEQALFEGFNKKKNEGYLTTAGWVKHLAWWLYYFKRLGVLPMEKNVHTPQLETLKPYFGPESGIDSPEKAFAFLLGTAYGYLLRVQAARGVNVSSNALTWLKRLTLKGRDLPSLYIKIREKLLIYEAEKRQDLRQLLEEIGQLGIRLGTNIQLDEVATNYYLLLGQSVANNVFPSAGKE
ncbi:MAG TPA: TM1802 family CRISPR-associated protein, partial [Candidatus Ozemobacteraceae bacterium]|nr:TM1802 family CRISPR-associated protein [Candidatus Ozemobacteraceae bacterium]